MRAARVKELSDLHRVSYVYGILYKLGIIEALEKYAKNMNHLGASTIKKYKISIKPCKIILLLPSIH